MKDFAFAVWRSLTSFMVTLWNTDLPSETEAAARRVERCRPQLAARLRRLGAHAWQER